MALTTRVITWDFTDIGQNPAHATVTISPSALLADSAGQVIVTASPETWNAYGAGGTITGLVTTDNAGISPAGWYYNITITADGMPGDSYPAFLPSGSGPVDLSELVVIVPSQQMGAYLPVSGGDVGTLELTGTPPLKLPASTSGDVLTSDGSGNITLQPSTGGGGAVTSVNTQTGAVVLTASSVGADASGAATTAQANAEAYAAMTALALAVALGS